MIDKINELINELDISTDIAEEIINIYFECYTQIPFKDYMLKCVYITTIQE